MTPFKNSLMLTASICGIIASPAMFLAWPFGHLSYNSALATSASNYVAAAGLLLLPVSGMGLFRALAAGPAPRERADARQSLHAIASVILGFPLLGLMTGGLTSLGGMVFGVIALKKICASDEIRGRRLAIGGICLSFSAIPYLAVMLLFLGP